jgi:hypothetical protein
MNYGDVKNLLFTLAAASAGDCDLSEYDEAIEKLPAYPPESEGAKLVDQIMRIRDE